MLLKLCKLEFYHSFYYFKRYKLIFYQSKLFPFFKFSLNFGKAKTLKKNVIS